MNAGELAELKQIATLASMRGLVVSVNDIKLNVNSVEIPTKTQTRIQIPSFTRDINPEYISTLNSHDLGIFCNENNIVKAPTECKADVYINNIGYSLKYCGSSPPAIVNHTSRNGWEFAAIQKNVDISLLDELIKEYWVKRINGIITEDVNNGMPESPFASHIDILLPYLEYFSFEGTGGKISVAPASYVIECYDPCNINTWKIIDKASYIREVWPRLVFSIRSKKGMPKNIDKSKYRDSIMLWSRVRGNELKGALHVRVS